MRIGKAAVVGAGTMGGGIAYVLSSTGLPVVVKDVVEAQLDLAREHLTGIYQRRVERGRIDAGEMAERLTLVSYALDYGGFGNVDIVIEAVPEDMSIKAAVLAELNEVCRPSAILASNTSALSITEMGVACGRPSRMVGMHFFNPAQAMRLVEVIPGRDTQPQVVETVTQLAVSVGKTPIVVRECPGFLVNRVLMPYLNEAVVCVQEGAATVPAIDAAMGPQGFGWPMGPFVLMDMLGLDVCHHIIAYLDAKYGERIREAALLEALCSAGRLGQKCGRGFYDHPGHQHSGEVDALVASLQSSGQVAKPGSAFHVDRLMAPLLNEAFLCVEQEIASVADIDTACVMGLGMAVRTGDDLVPMGPLAYADRLGLEGVLAQMEGLARDLGSRFTPAPILVEKVQARRRGQASGLGFTEGGH